MGIRQWLTGKDYRGWTSSHVTNGAGPRGEDMGQITLLLSHLLSTGSEMLCISARAGLLQLTSVIEWCKEWQMHLWEYPRGSKQRCGSSVCLWWLGAWLLPTSCAKGTWWPLLSSKLKSHLSFPVDPWTHKAGGFPTPGVQVLVCSPSLGVFIHFVKPSGRQSIMWGQQELSYQPAGVTQGAGGYG